MSTLSDLTQKAIASDLAWFWASRYLVQQKVPGWTQKWENSFFLFFKLSLLQF